MIRVVCSLGLLLVAAADHGPEAETQQMCRAVGCGPPKPEQGLSEKQCLTAWDEFVADYKQCEIKEASEQNCMSNDYHAMYSPAELCAATTKSHSSSRSSHSRSSSRSHSHSHSRSSSRSPVTTLAKESGCDRVCQITRLLVGSYENHQYDKGGKNDWHYVTLSAKMGGTCEPKKDWAGEKYDGICKKYTRKVCGIVDARDEYVGRCVWSASGKSSAGELMWRNRAGKSWTLTVQADAPEELLVGEDCPYFKEGHKTVSVEFDDNRNVIRLAGPWGEFYDRHAEGPLCARWKRQYGALRFCGMLKATEQAECSECRGMDSPMVHSSAAASKRPPPTKSSQAAPKRAPAIATAGPASMPSSEAMTCTGFDKELLRVVGACRGRGGTKSRTWSCDDNMFAPPALCRRAADTFLSRWEFRTTRCLMVSMLDEVWLKKHGDEAGEWRGAEVEALLSCPGVRAASEKQVAMPSFSHGNSALREVESQAQVALVAQASDRAVYKGDCSEFKEYAEQVVAHCSKVSCCADVVEDEICQRYAIGLQSLFPSGAINKCAHLVKLKKKCTCFVRQVSACALQGQVHELLYKEPWRPTCTEFPAMEYQQDNGAAAAELVGEISFFLFGGGIFLVVVSLLSCVIFAKRHRAHRRQFIARAAVLAHAAEVAAPQMAVVATPSKGEGLADIQAAVIVVGVVA